jgi:CheY-like chemotaxis protein
MKSVNNPPKIILYVDDDQDDHYLFKYALNKVNPAVILQQARDGKKAVDFLTQAKLFGDLPCLIIIDMNMPLMNGIETVERIKQDADLCTIPVVVFTTSLKDSDLTYWKGENIPAFTKPDNIEGLTDCIVQILSLQPWQKQ